MHPRFFSPLIRVDTYSTLDNTDVWLALKIKKQKMKEAVE